MTELRLLVDATRKAYNALAAAQEAGGPAPDVYPALIEEYAAHGLNADVAESSVDWLDFCIENLVDSLTDALARR